MARATRGQQIIQHTPMGRFGEAEELLGTMLCLGDGHYEEGIEFPRVTVKLATLLSPEDCKQLPIGYQHPKEIQLEAWQDREDEGILVVYKAGETLYRVKS